MAGDTTAPMALCINGGFYNMAISAAAAALLGTALSSGTSFTGQLLANRANREIAELNRQAVLTSNRENIAFQQAENAITREREDNAFQRAAADLQAAGLSKTLAAGSPASAASLAAPQVQAATLNHKEENLMKDINLASTFTGLIQGIAQANKTSEEAKGQAISNQYAEEKAEAELKATNALADERSASAELSRIYGDNASRKIEYEIEGLILSNQYTTEQIEKIVAEKYHINTQNAYLLEQIIEAQLKQKEMRHDIKIAENLGMPVGSVPTGLLGSSFTTGMALKYALKNSINNLSFSNVPFNGFGGGNLKAW